MGVSSPLGLALVVGVPSLGIFLVSSLLCLFLLAVVASASACHSPVCRTGRLLRTAPVS
jgi:hypothetical protein